MTCFLHKNESSGRAPSTCFSMNSLSTPPTETYRVREKDADPQRMHAFVEGSEDSPFCLLI